MQQVIEGFVGGSWEARSKSLDVQKTINFYPEVSESGSGRTSSMLIPSPGLRYFSSTGGVSTGGRHGGLFTASNGKAYHISGNKLTEFLPNGGATLRGTLNTSVGSVAMAENSTCLFICDSLYYYTYNLTTNVFTTLSDSSLTGSTHIGFLNGFFIVNCPNDALGRAIFRWSPVNWDGVSPWDPLDFASADNSTDRLDALAVVGSEIWFLGSNGYEIRYAGGDPEVPFSRSPNAAYEAGVLAKYSLALISGSLFYLASSRDGAGQVLRTTGYQVQRVSTHGIEKRILSWSSAEDTIGFAYQQEGHSFYCLSSQSGNCTLVYDLTTQLWHERTWTDPVTQVTNRWRPIAATQFGGKVLVSDSISHVGIGDLLFFLDLGYYKEDLDATTSCRIIRKRITPYQHANGDKLFFNSLEVFIEVGVGDIVGEGSDPKIMMSYSDDGGNTWSNKRFCQTGKVGEYKRRVFFRRCGSSRSRVWEISISDPVKAVLLGAVVDVTREST